MTIFVNCDGYKKMCGFKMFVRNHSELGMYCATINENLEKNTYFFSQFLMQSWGRFWTRFFIVELQFDNGP